LSEKRSRRVVQQPRFQAELKPILSSILRAEEAWKGFSHAVARIPEMGMAVPGRSGFYSRPFHTEQGSFLVIYTFDDEKVVCLGLRAVPSNAY
jgi:hypothetical protein